MEEHYGLRDGRKLRAYRAKNYHLHRTVTERASVEQLVLITPDGNFIAETQFVGLIHIEIINGLWVDYLNQTVRKVDHNFPVKLIPGMEVSFG